MRIYVTKQCRRASVFSFCKSERHTFYVAWKHGAPTVCVYVRFFTGKYIVTGSSDQMVKVWLYNEGVPTHIGAGHAGVVTNVKVSPNGRFVVSTSADGGIFLWRFPHAADTAPPSSSGRRSVNDGGGSPREQQTDRSRQLSLKKTLPARKENINVISKGQNVRVAEHGVVAGDAAADGSVKCLCRRGTTCVCGDSGRASHSSVP